jgi:hypothetical protein
MPRAVFLFDLPLGLLNTLFRYEAGIPRLDIIWDKDARRSRRAAPLAWGDMT